MKCSNCGYENKDNAKFCTKCGGKLVSKTPDSSNQSSNNNKLVIALLVVIIVVLVAAIGFFALSSNSDSTSSHDDKAQSVDSDDSNSKNTTQVVSSSKSKSWESIGSYSGSGTGSQTIKVPSGKIMVKLSSFPIKNYADNHLHVTGSNGASGGVDWGPTSDVETRSDSFEFTSSKTETFTIDYYETVSWEVEFFRYQ